MASQNILAPPPIKTPALGKDGTFSSPWVMYFQKLTQRMGGAVSDTLEQTNTNVATNQTNIATLQGQQTATTAAVTTLNGEVVTLTAGQTTQAAQIAAIQAELAPGISATITTAKLTVGGANGSMTFTNGILTAQIQAT